MRVSQGTQVRVAADVPDVFLSDMHLRALFSKLRLSRVLLVAVATVSGVAAAPLLWRPAIDAFTRADAAHPPAAGSVVFVGSSSILKWVTLAQDFPDISTLNRGFGGSELADSVYYADRIVIPYHPRMVVVYAGENDLQAGKTPEQVFADWQAFRQKVHAALPTVPILFLSIKESPSREKIRAAVLKTNALIRADCAAAPHCRYIDVATPMLDPQGHTRPELFQDDMLHMKPAGYAIWTRVLAPELAHP